jgi:hypothetical protein
MITLRFPNCLVVWLIASRANNAHKMKFIYEHMDMSRHKVRRFLQKKIYRKGNS